MTGQDELNAEVQRVLEEKKGMGGVFRMWKSRFKKNLLSLDLKIKIVEEFGNSDVLLILNPKTNETTRTLLPTTE